MSHHLTQHAHQRSQQRGIKLSDIDLLLECGTPISDEAILLLKGDAQREIAKRKREIEALQRLAGCKAIVRGMAVITVYKPSITHRKIAVRSSKERCSHV